MTLDIKELQAWARRKKRFDPTFAMIISVPEYEGLFLACPCDTYSGLFVFPKEPKYNESATKLRGWGYAVYRAKDPGHAMDCLLEYINGL